MQDEKRELYDEVYAEGARFGTLSGLAIPTAPPHIPPDQVRCCRQRGPALVDCAQHAQAAQQRIRQRTRAPSMCAMDTLANRFLHRAYSHSLVWTTGRVFGVPRVHVFNPAKCLKP